MAATIGLLTPKQKLFTSEFSQVLVQESSSQYDHTASSDDELGKVLDKAKEYALKKMIRSKDQTDNRLLDMVRVQQARHLGIKIGFNGLNQDNYDDKQVQSISVDDNNNVEF